MYKRQKLTDGRIVFSACNAHARRYVFNARQQHPELSSQILAIYRALYDIEERGSRLDPTARLLLRRRESVPLMKDLEALLQGPSAQGLLPKSKLATALAYIRNNWESLKRFLSDGRLPIDNNDAERDLRRIAVGRKNWVFVGSRNGGERTAVILTVVASAHRHDLDVWAYLRDVLQRLAEGEESDFYGSKEQAEDDSSSDRRRLVAGYAALYKLLPLLPGPVIRWLVARHRARWLRWISAPLWASSSPARSRANRCTSGWTRPARATRARASPPGHWPGPASPIT